MTHISRLVRRAGLSLAMATLLAGCFEPNTAQLIANGKARLEKKEFRAASIDFKSALQKEPNNAEVRFLLGKALLDLGDFSGAGVEFAKAREAGYPNDEVAPLTATVLMLSGQPDKLIADLGGVVLKAPQRQAELQAALATAYGAKGQFERAQAAVDAALQADANNMVAQLARAQLLMARGDAAAALAQVDRTVAAHPASGRPWVVKAELLRSTGGAADTIVEAYRQALAADKRDIQARVGLIEQYLQRRDWATVEQQIVELDAAVPNSLQSRYFKALMAFEKRDLDAAQASSQQLLKAAPDHPPFLQLAGMVEYERGNYLQAMAHLNKALPSSAAPVAVRVLLARAQLKAGDARKALAFVLPVLESDQASSEALAVAADCYQELGEAEGALRMYARSAKLNPDDARSRTLLALSKLADGRTDQAMSELKSVAASTASTEAEVVMVINHLRNRRFDEAAAVIDGLEAKQPGAPVAPYLRGRLALMQGQKDQARGFFEQSLSRKPDYEPALSVLVGMDAEEGKLAQVVARHEKWVAAAPKSVEARLALIAARARAGAKPDEIRAQLEEAIKLFPASDLPRLNLVAHLIDRGDSKQAVQVAAEAVARFPEHAGLLQAQGVAEMADGNYNQAAQTFGRVANLRPGAVEPLMSLVELELARKDSRAAVNQLRKVLSLRPGYLPAQARLIAVLAQMGRGDEALRVAKEVQTQAPAEAWGWQYEGELQASQGKKVAAAVAFRTAHAKRPTDETAIKLHRTLLVAGQTAEADKLLADWKARKPDSPVFNAYLGDQALARREFEAAEQAYRKVLATQPGNVAVLNNLAWLLHRAGKPGAVEMCEKALAVAPNSPAVMDTLAEIHAAGGRLDKALALQKQAVELEPAQGVRRLHLAKYLIQSNKKGEARGELQRLAELGDAFAQQDEVRKLMSSL